MYDANNISKCKKKKLIKLEDLRVLRKTKNLIKWILKYPVVFAAPDNTIRLLVNLIVLN